MLSSVRIRLAVLAVTAAAMSVVAQEPTSLMNAKGNSPLAVYSAGDFDNVNPLNGNIFLSIPLVSYPQRGHALSFGFNIFYNSNLWIAHWTDVTAATWAWSDGGRTNVGAFVGRTQSLSMGSDINYTHSGWSDSGRNSYDVILRDNSSWVRETNGAKHYVGDVLSSSCVQNAQQNCPSLYGYNTNQKWFSASDSTGYYPTSDGYSNLLSARDARGNTHSWPNNYETTVDTNGNQIVASQSGWTDTIGRSIPGGISSPGTNDNIDQSTSSQSSLNSFEPYPGVPAASVGSTTCPSGSTSARVWTVPGVSGSSQTYYLCYTKQAYKTAFNASTTQTPYYTFYDASSSGASATLLTAVMLPDNTSYKFAYDSYLSLTSITLPTGGSISYTWQNLPYGHPYPQGTFPSRAIATRTVNSLSGSAQTWTYSYNSVVGSGGAVTLWSIMTDPNGNDTEYQSDPQQLNAKSVYTGCGPHNTSAARTCSGTGTVLLQESYQNTGVGSLGADNPTAAFSASQYTTQRIGTTTTLGSGTAAVTKNSSITFPPAYSSCTFQTLYPSNNPQPAQSNTYSKCINSLSVGSTTQTDFGSPGSGSPGSPLQTTTNTYQWQVNGSYLSANLVNLVASTVITNGSGVQAAATSYGYDESGSPQGVLGNNTSQSRWVGVGQPQVVTKTSFTSQGMPQTTTDANGKQTSIQYDSTGMFPSSITRPSTGVAHVDAYRYDPTTGGVLSHTDENNQTTTYSYQRSCVNSAFDPFGRLGQITYPSTAAGTAIMTYCYDDSANSWNMITIDPLSATTTTNYDGLGRAINFHDNGAGVVRSTQYDFAGRTAFTSNPSTTVTSVGTNYAYDALGRMVLQTNPDGTTKSWVYQGSSTQSYDEASNQRQQTTDGLGRLIAVAEITPGQPVCTISGGSKRCSQGGISATTQYSYDALGNLLAVAQLGTSGETARNRSFTYDGLSRLLTATNPETGTVCYGVWSSGACVNGYDANGNLLAITNATGNGTLFGYDALNRIATKAYFAPGYTDAPIKRFYYDGANPTRSLAIPANSYQVGRLSMARSWAPFGDGWHDEYQGYDAMGRVTRRTEVSQSESGTGGHTFSMGYDVAGNLTSLTYPDGRTVNQAYDAAERLASVIDGSGQPYLSSVTYFPNNIPQLMGTANVLAQQFSLNSRLQVCDSSFGNQFGTLMSRQYFFGSDTTSGHQCNLTAGDNGNIYHVMDALNGANSQHYSYDALNRLTQWNGASPAGAVRQQSFGYDSFGNLTQATGGTPTPASSVFDGNNHVQSQLFQCTGVSGQTGGYDAAGNQLCTGVQNSNAQAFAYNEENQLVLSYVQQNSNSYNLRSLYSYDSSGQRIRADQYDPGSGTKTGWREYTYWNGNVLAEKDQNGVWTDYVSGAGKKIAMVPQNETVLQVSGKYSGGWQGTGYTVSAPSLANYVFRAGDVLLVRQRKFGTNVHGGILIYGNGVGSYFNDQDGQRADDDTLGSGSWHNRRIPLDGLQGKTYSGLSMGGGTSTDYTFQFASVAVSSADGTVRTVLGGEPESFSFAGGISTGSGSSVPVAADANATRFYAQDQVGTMQMEVSAAGYPLWRGEFSPFGLEADINPTQNRYKFTGKERDTESGLDYFGARYYSSSLGRFMSPDWSASPEAVPYSHLENPQSLNLYGYVLNNPLSKPDLDGHGCPPDCSTGNPVADFFLGASNAWSSDNLGGAGRTNQSTLSGQLGQSVGDSVAAVQGIVEMAVGGTGVGGGLVYAEATGDGSGTAFAAGSAALTVHGAETTVVAMGKGSYTNTHESGTTYHGKGDATRAAESGKEKAAEHNDKHVSTDHSTASTDRESFKNESRRLDAHGGPGSNQNYNKIESPGKKYRQQDGSN